MTGASPWYCKTCDAWFVPGHLCGCSSPRSAGAHAEQPMPVASGRPSVQGMVRDDLTAREAHGITVYGTPLQTFNRRDAIRDAYEEALDLAVYLKQVAAEAAVLDVALWRCAMLGSWPPRWVQNAMTEDELAAINAAITRHRQTLPAPVAGIPLMEEPVMPEPTSPPAHRPAPQVGQVVHYVSYGTPGGEYRSECRAALVTEVDRADPGRVGLCAINPGGLFFHPLTAGGCWYHGGDPGTDHTGEPVPQLSYPGGSWHWPEWLPGQGILTLPLPIDAP
jgi:hypothetical protein